MDLIYTNSEGTDEGILLSYSLDMAFGIDENTFELTVDEDDNVCEKGSRIYFNQTEYGGIVDSIEVITKDQNIKYSGRTWHGILNSKVIEPDSGEDYYILSNIEVNAALKVLINRLGLSDLFEVTSESTGFTITSYQFDRYISGYEGIFKMLNSLGMKLKMNYITTDEKVMIKAVDAKNYSNDNDFNSVQFQFDSLKNYHPVNHLICLGKGELKDRLVLHLYTDSEGNISSTQILTGLDERTETYELSNEEDIDKIRESGIEKLLEYWNADKASIEFEETDEMYDLGDIVSTTDTPTGLEVVAEITKKIISVTNGMIDFDFKTTSVSSQFYMIGLADDESTAAAPILLADDDGAILVEHAGYRVSF